jgi:CHASE3 domain sensor protein
MSESTERTLSLAFGLALAVLIVNAVFSYMNIGRLISGGGSVIHSREALGEIEGLMANLRTVEVGERGYIITGARDEADGAMRWSWRAMACRGSRWRGPKCPT